MSFLLSPKYEGDLDSWRASTNFVDFFHSALIENSNNSDTISITNRLQKVASELEQLQVFNRFMEEKFLTLTGTLATINGFAQLHIITEQYYEILYEHIERFHAAPAFYEQSTLFLCAITTAIVRISKEQLGLLERNLPEHAVIALGTAGRNEFSPFCPLQLLLLCRHEHGMEIESIRQLGALIHEGFVASGLQVDSVITPKNGHWCGSLQSWNHLWETELNDPDSDHLIDLLRLADQQTIGGSQRLGDEFSQQALKALGTSNCAVENLISRVAHLSNGLGILGRLRLEKSGPYQGRFPLLDHALLPLTSAVSAFALIAAIPDKSSPMRLYRLITKNQITVDLAEQLLEAWHTINELRLLHEQQNQPNWRNAAPLHLNLDKLTDDEQQSLRFALEAIGLFQRYLYGYFFRKGRNQS